MKTANKKPKIKERLLMVYVRRNIRLALILSIGTLILVLVASSTGGFCYFSSKKSMSLAAKESPVDVVFRQDTYTVGTRTLPRPHKFLQMIYDEADVVDAYGLAAIVIDLNVTVNHQDRGIHRILILLVSKREGFNVTLSQGSPIHGSTEMLVSEDFFEKFNATLGERITLKKVISKEPLKLQYVPGYATGVTPKHFSQLIKELGLHEALFLAGHTEAELLSFDEYPFVLLDMSSTILPLYFLDYASKHHLPSILATFFVKFDDEVYLNPWDTDITVFNLKELAQNLRQDMNNLTSTQLGHEYNVISIRAVPAATIFQELSRFININKLTVIAFGATVAFVGWYFYTSLTQTALSARTEELQLMRVRGISQKSITRSIYLIIVASGIIGTTAGLLLGFVITTNIGSTIFNISITQADITQTFGISSLLFYAFFGLAASIISQRQALTKVKTVIPRAEEAGTEAKSKMGLTEKLVLAIALSLGSIKVASWLLGINLISGAQTANPITSAILLFVRLIDQTILDASGALLLIYALVTILSRCPKILSTISQWISRVLSPRLSLLSKKIMSAKSAKMAGITIVTSLLIFNTVSANMGYCGVEVAWKNLSTTIVGADIRIDMPEEAFPPVIQLLDNISGVEDYTQILTITSNIGPPLGSSVVYAIDPEKYATILKIKGEAPESMTAGDSFVSDFFHEMGLLNIGDTVALEGKKELVVRGFIKSLPGLLSIPPIERFAVISVGSIEYLDYTVISRTLLVRGNSIQPDIVVEDLMNSLPESVRLKLSAATESQITAKFGGRMATPLIVESVMSILLIASIVSLVFAALALGVMGYSDAIERRSLDALLWVKGVTRWQLLGMALSEALCMLALSLIVGFFAGYAMASGYTSYFSATFPVNAAPAPSYELVTQLLMLIATYLIAFLAPALYAMKKPVRFHIH
jgi:ABC-type antimicrobial peptide transport system permease subunit